MICTVLLRNLTRSFSKNLGKSRVPFSRSVLDFSTYSESKPLNSSSVYEFLVQKHKFSPVVASHVASALTHLKDQENCDSILSFLKGIGFTKSQLERALKYRPNVLSASLEKIIKPKIKIFQDMGFSAKEIAEIISKEPGILNSSVNNRLIPGLSLLKGMLGSNEEVAKALRKSGWLLMTDLETNMVPNVKFLKSCGVQMEQIAMLRNYLPRFLLYKPEVVRKCVDKVEGMGVSRSSRMFVYAVAAVGSMSNGVWELKLQAFQNILQFSEDDILRVVRQAPQVFMISEDKMKKVKEVLLGTGKYKTSCIVRYPKSLAYSIEQRYKPRIEILRILERRHLIVKWPCLQTLFVLSDERFFEKFVSPHMKEVGDVYLAYRALNNKRNLKLMPAA